VTVAKPGDPVLLSYNSCNECRFCQTGHSAYCVEFFDGNFKGNRVFSLSTSKSGEYDINGSFFGQSSFANFSIAEERSVVNVTGFLDNIEELRSLAPLG
jgi:Zn-dependent alcohol dehydrogenase